MSVESEYELPEHIKESMAEFAKKNPQSEFHEAWAFLQNLIGPQEPDLILKAADEPSLQRDAPPDFEAYRFERHGSLERPFIIRIQRDKSGSQLVAKIRETPEIGDDWIWPIHRNTVLSPADFEALAALLDRAGFWSTPYSSSEEVGGFDVGWTTITGRQTKRYHAVTRFPQLPTGLEAAFRLAEKLAGFKESD